MVSYPGHLGFRYTIAGMERRMRPSPEWPNPDQSNPHTTNTARAPDTGTAVTRRAITAGAAGLIGGGLLSQAAAQGATAGTLQGTEPSNAGFAYRFVSVSDGRKDEARRLADLLATVPDGAVVELRGHWLLGSRVELRDRYDVTIDGRGATITLMATAWRDPAAFVMRDCHRTTIHDIVFVCNGKAFVAAGLADKAPTALAVISTAANAGADRKRSSAIEIACTFLDMAQRGLGVRLVDGVRIGGRFAGRARATTSFCDVVRCDRVDLVPDSSSDGPYAQLGGSDYAVSPGSFYVDAAQAEFNFEPAINWCGLTHYQKPFEETAPSGTSQWTLDFSDGDASMPDGYDYVGNSWFFTCIDDAGAEDICTEQLRVTMVPGTRRATVRLFDLDGHTPRPFRGQRFRITSIATKRFCRSIRVHDGTIRNSAGAGVMLLGCDGITVVNNVSEDCFDYGIDLEWSINAAITGNTVRNTIRANGGIGVLFFFRNVAVSGNVVVNAVNADAAISAFGSGQANAYLAISDNVIDGGAIRLGLTDQAWFTGEDVLIERNMVRNATCAVYVRGNPGHLACAKGIRIAACRFTAIGQQPIALLSVSDVAIVGNDVQGTLYRGLCNIEGRAGLNRRIHIADCTIRGGGYGWAGLPMVLYQGPAAAAPVVTQHGNWIADEGLSIGVNRPFYQAEGGVEVPALRRGEVRLAVKGRVVAPGAGVGIETAMSPARTGQPMIAVALEPQAGWTISAAVVRAGYVMVTLTNSARTERTFAGTIAIVPA